MKSGLGLSCDFLDYRPIGLHLEEQPVLSRCTLLYRGVKVFFARFHGMLQRMDFGVLIGNGFQKLPILVIDQDARVALGADVEVPKFVSTQSDTGILVRSEEHTSELQSRGHLVCRLLLEKKKQQCFTHPSCRAYYHR